MSAMLKKEELPQVNSPRWMSLEDFEGEIWKEIPNLPLYKISNYSRIKSFVLSDRIKIIRPNLRRGYLGVTLSIDGNGKHINKGVHRLMAETFIPNPKNLPQVNHNDENKLNNLIDNLEWCTNSYNMNYGTRNARAGQNISYANSISISQYSLDGKYIATFRGINEASRILGLNIVKPKNGWKSQFSQSCGYMWRLHEDGVDVKKDIPPYIQISGHATIIEQYTKENVYIGTFASASYASKSTGIPLYKIYNCLNGKINSAGGYIWKPIDRNIIYEGLVFNQNGYGKREEGFKNIDKVNYKTLKKQSKEKTKCRTILDKDDN